MLTRKQIDFLVVFTYLLITTLSILYYKPGYIVGTMLYFFVPALYLTVRYWNIYRHVIVFSWVFGTLGGFTAEIISHSNRLWIYEPSIPALSFQGKPMEALFWYVLYIWLVVAVYKVFFEKHKHPNNKYYFKNHVAFFVVLILLFLIFITAYFISPGIFVMQYAYAKAGIVFVVVPVVYALARHPNLIGGILKASLTMLVLALAYETVGLHLDWWHYEAESLKNLAIAGIVLPIEELIFWIILGAACVVGWYEEFERGMV